MMFKSLKRRNLLGHRLRFSHINTSIFVLILALFFLLPPAIGQESNVVEEAQKQVRSWWANSQVYVGVIILVFAISSIGYLIRLFKKDKLLKKLLDKYVVFQMKDGQRYRGTMRLEFTGMEIISEESRQRGHAPSYIFKSEEREAGIVAYIRYLDSMNTSELRERAWELERVYHPPLFYKIGRKIRNMFIALREALDEAISMVWKSFRRGADARLTRYSEAYQTAADGDFEKRLQELEDESASYLEQESYERLIERLIGTRVKVRVRVGEDNTEYTAILKDYNNKHIALMNVKDKDNNGYKDEWEYECEFKKNLDKLNVRDDRGLRCRAEGNTIIFENNTPYPIQLGRIHLWEDAPRWEKDYKYEHHIPAFSIQEFPLDVIVNRKVKPFDRVSTRHRHAIRNYKKIFFKFRSFRDADIVFPRRYCTIVESAEKYQPELFSLTGLTDAILDMRDTEDIAITDKDGEPIHGINVVHGYVTNINEERIDLKSIDASYSRRWNVENAFRHFDNKLRHGFSIYRRLLPTNRGRIAAYTTIIEQIHNNPIRHAALGSLAYPQTRNLNTAEQRKRSLQRARNRILGYVDATINGKLWKPENGTAKSSSKIRSEVQIAMPLKLMAFTGNTSTVEFPVLERFEYVQGHHIIYDHVQNLRTDKLAKTDILWIGNGEIYKSGYRLNIDAEHRIKNFVSQGGIVLVSGQDIKASAKQRRGTGWIPEPLTGIECEETYELFPTPQGKRSRIFQSPNPLNGNHQTYQQAMDQPLIRLDDMWLDPLGKWTSLAKTNTAAAGLPSNGFENASPLLLLPFQKGLYIVTSLKNETEEDVQINDKIMENLLHFSVKWLDRQKGS
ncbi:MAG: hypothetical protein OXN25_02945 [Candidatus Poribacteria bacterium]|nr:hypothetical protein [Candidatus Poribacteria bacterium]